MRENPTATAREAALRAAGLPAVDLGAVVAEQDDPLVFATVSGAHLYGFPSRDSDVDLRGAHLLPAAALVGLREPEETRTRMWERGAVEPLLYTLRVLLTGIHLMASGRVQPHLPTLSGELSAPAYIPELIAAKEAAEHGPAGEVVDPARLRRDIEALHAAQAATALLDAPRGRDALHDLIVRVRPGLTTARPV